MSPRFYEAKLPNLKLKSQSKLLLGSLPFLLWSVAGVYKAGCLSIMSVHISLITQWLDSGLHNTHHNDIQYNDTQHNSEKFYS